MSPKALKKRSTVVSAPERAQKTMSREAKAMYAEVQQCVRQLDKSIAEIERGVKKAERGLEADARTKIRELRKNARTHLALLKSKQREAAGTLKLVPPAAAESSTWDDITRGVNSVLNDARATASATVTRFRSALGG